MGSSSHISVGGADWDCSSSEFAENEFSKDSNYQCKSEPCKCYPNTVPIPYCRFHYAKIPTTLSLARHHMILELNSGETKVVINVLPEDSFIYVT